MILSKENYKKEMSIQISELFKQLSLREQINIEDLLFDNNYNNYIISCHIDNGKIVGMASLCCYKTISGHKGWIEDVVVDESMRGKGIGNQLISELIIESEKLNLIEILLFTELEKESAISLYSKLGFKKRNSIILVKK